MKLEITRIITIFIALSNMASCSNEGKKMDHLVSSYDGKACEVYFFKSWSTYSHPVTPTGAIGYEEAMGRDGFYRAWMCNINNIDLFVLFEGVELSKNITGIEKSDQGDASIRFYESVTDGDAINKGRELNYGETLGRESFLASLCDEGKYLILIKQDVAVSYEYIYNSTGRLEEVVVKDFEGNYRKIEY